MHLPALVAAIEKAENVTSLIKVLEKHSGSLDQNISSLDSIIETFDVENWTCVHAFVLRSKLSAPSTDLETLIPILRNFFIRGNIEHIRMLKPVVYQISRGFTALLISRSLAVRGISILLTALKRVRTCPEQLTSIHADVCQLALSAKCFHAVIQLLETEVLDTESDKAAFELRDSILYFYYGGMIYAALKNWSRSLHFFDMCFMLPLTTAKSIIIEAAKKYLIISLIHFGKYPPESAFPDTSHSIIPMWKGNLEHYLKLAEAFNSPDPTKLTNVISQHADLFKSDKNYGLVKQLLDKQIKWRIRNLTKTFMTLSLADVALRVHLEDAKAAEQHLLEMIASKLIHVKINQRDGTVQFLDDPEQYDSAEMLRVLTQKMESAISLERKMMAMTDHLAICPPRGQKHSSHVH